MTDAALRALLAAAVRRAGGVRAWAVAVGVDPGDVTRSARGPVRPSVARVLGYLPVRAWEPVPVKQANGPARLLARRGKR